MQVNKLPLPSYLVELIESGRWKKPDNILVLSEMTGVQRPEGFSFLSIDGMERETNGGYFIVENGQGNIYGIYSSRDSEESLHHADFVDIANSIIIADNWDEEVICLDYRENQNDPSVVLSIYPTTNEGSVQWKMLAKNFREFADRLNL
jgi:hypothetical protein